MFNLAIIVSCSFVKSVAELFVAESVNEQTSFLSESMQKKLKMLKQLYET